MDDTRARGTGTHSGKCGLAVFEVFVPGHPAPQGSKRHVGNGVMIESSRSVKTWRDDVRAAVAREHPPMLERGVAVELTFVMRRPTATPKRHTPPAVKRPDLDKLTRAILDALGSAGTWRDDAQVIALAATKRLANLGETPGCHIAVYPVEPNQ